MSEHETNEWIRENHKRFLRDIGYVGLQNRATTYYGVFLDGERVKMVNGKLIWRGEGPAKNAVINSFGSVGVPQSIYWDLKGGYEQIRQALLPRKLEIRPISMNEQRWIGIVETDYFRYIWFSTVEKEVEDWAVEVLNEELDKNWTLEDWREYEMEGGFEEGEQTIAIDIQLIDNRYTSEQI